jgi:Zn-dependent protease with chaperone function
VGYLAHILIAAGALFAYEQGLRTGLRSTAGVVALCAVPYVLMWADRRLVLRGAFSAAMAVHKLLTWFGPLGFALATCALGWPAEVARLTGDDLGLAGWPSGALFVIFAPFLVYTWLSIDALARTNEVRSVEVARARNFQTRMLLAALAPFVLFLVITWAVGSNARLRANVEQVALWSAALTVGLALVAVGTLPALLRRTWDTAPLPAGGARTALESFAQHARFRCNAFLVWRTGHRMANAAVVGVGARQRVVIFSDLLLAQLPLRELVAVLAHEIGHVARHHVLTFIAWSSAVFLGLDLALASFELESEWALGAALFATVGVWWGGFGWLSRRSELEADLYALHTTGDVMAMVSALEIVGGPHARAKDSWRHFSTARRVEFLLRAAEDEGIGARLTRQMRLLSRLGIALALVAGAAQVWRLAKSYPDDRARVELALGRYERASELATDDERVAPLTRRLAELGAALPAEQRTNDGLELAARAALSSGDAKRAGELLNLLSLRGVARADELLSALDAERAEHALEALRAADPAWAEALEAGLRRGPTEPPGR